MAKKVLIISIIAIVLVLSIVTAILYNQQTAFFDPYLILDDFTFLEEDKYQFNTESISGQSICPRTRASTVNVEDGQLILTFQGNMKAEVIRFEDLKEKDLKIRGEFIYSSPSHAGEQIGIVEFHLGNKIIFKDTITLFTADSSVSQTNSYLLEFRKDFINPNLINIEVNGLPGESVLVEDETIQLKFVAYGTTRGLCFAQPSGRLAIDYIKYGNYESCDLEDDEAVWTGRYDSGKELSIKDIPFRITKFCVAERPVIKRNIETGGERANLEGSIYQKLRDGETIIVPQNFVYEVPVGIDFIQGMPLSNCPLGSYEDDNGKCNQRIFEQEDIVEFINIHEFITIGKEDVLFDNSLSFADKEITSEKPEYLCADEDPKANSPDPRPECWNLEVFFNGQSYDFFYDEEKSFNGLKLKALPEAKYENKKIEEYTNHFVLSVTDDILQSEVIETAPKDYWVIFGKDEEIKFKITNNLGDFKSGESGIQIRRKTMVLTGESTELVNIPFKKGTAEYSVKVESEMYDEFLYVITFWYRIGDKLFYDNEVIARNYKVVDEIPIDVEVVEKIVEIEKLVDVEKIVEVEKVPAWVYMLSVFIILGFIIILFKLRK